MVINAKLMSQTGGCQAAGNKDPGYNFFINNIFIKYMYLELFLLYCKVLKVNPSILISSFLVRISSHELCIFGF